MSIDLLSSSPASGVTDRPMPAEPDMLMRTFQHIPRVGEKTELDLWSRGVHTWRQFLDRKDHLSLGRSSSGLMVSHLEQSFEALERRDVGFFFQHVPSKQYWRLFPVFQDRMLYLDIETTGSSPHYCHITTIGIYDGHTARAFVRGRDLQEFPGVIQAYDVLVTYNGRSFDAPWIETEMRVRLPAAHIDLRYLLAALGCRGGLKGAERQLGIGREGPLAQVDGYFAVLLWKHYQKTKDPRVLDTLIRYNLEDVVKLKPLLQMAYNIYLRRTPFEDLPECRVDPVLEVDVPIYQEVIDDVRASYPVSYSW